MLELLSFNVFKDNDEEDSKAFEINIALQKSPALYKHSNHFVTFTPAAIKCT